MMRISRVPLLLGVWLSGCTFDFTGPPDEATSAEFLVQATAYTDGDQLIVTASLMPGTGDDGELRTVLRDPTVQGTAIAPSVTTDNGSRSYELERTLSAELPAGGLITIIAPDVEGLPFDSRQISLFVPALIGSDSLLVTSDDPVVLHITPQPPGDWTSQWHLNVFEAQGTAHFAVQGNGYPPAEIVIPRSWFRSDASIYDVRLDIVQSQVGDFVPGQYRWAASSRTQMQWTVRFSTGNLSTTR